MKYQSFVYTQLNDQTVLFQIIQVSESNSSIWPIDRTLSGVTIPSQSEPGSDGNERILHITQSSSITGASATECFMSSTEHSLKKGS